MMSGAGISEAANVLEQDIDVAVVSSSAAATNSAANLGVSAEPWERFASNEELKAWLLEAAVAEYGHLFGQPAYSNWYWGRPVLWDGDAVFRTMETVLFASGAATNDYSTTNVQVERVDEADLVETDGDFLYIISDRDLVIVQAGVGDELRVVSRLRLDERPVGMYLAGDRLAIISSRSSGPYGNRDVFPGMFVAEPWDDRPGWHRPTTTVTVLDITDRAAPMLVQKTEMDGQLVTSRVVDGQLRLVLSNHFQLPMPIARPVEGQPTKEGKGLVRGPFTIQPVDGDVRGAITDVALFQPAAQAMMFDSWYDPWASEQVYETKEEYVARVADELFESILPQIRSLDVDGSVLSETPLVDANNVYRPESSFDRHITTIATFDLASNAEGPADRKSVFSGWAEVYASEGSVYLFTQPSYLEYGRGGSWEDTNKTRVWKFDIDAQTHDVNLVAKGAIDGTLLNQFAADEHEGYLRIVTKSDVSWSAGHSVLVLDQVGSQLKLVGSVSEIAPNEQLYSVRFVGERAFFVTFRTVDPLFAVDLSDPTDPELLGELHIPGYSDYLQPIDENHLLAIGRGADERTGQFQELQVSIFDVSDMTDPQLLHRYSFEGGRTTETPATGDRWQRGDGNHHAVSYFAAEQIFALPIFTAEDLGWWSNVTETPLFESGQGGLQVFRIDVDAGFTPLGVIEHDTRVERSIRIGDRLYAISSGMVSVHELANPAAELGRIEIGTESNQLTQLTAFRPPVEVRLFALDELSKDRAATVLEVPFLIASRPTYAPPVRAAAFVGLPRARSLEPNLEQFHFRCVGSRSVENSFGTRIR